MTNDVLTAWVGFLDEHLLPAPVRRTRYDFPVGVTNVHISSAQALDKTTVTYAALFDANGAVLGYSSVPKIKLRRGDTINLNWRVKFTGHYPT